MDALLQRLKAAFKTVFHFTINNVILWTVFAIICLKSVILIGFLVNGDHSTYSIISGLRSIPSLPVYLSFITATLAFAFLFKGKQQIWFLVGIDVFISMLFIFDLMHYRAFESFVSPYMLEEVGNLTNLRACVASMLRSADIVFLLDIPVLILLIYFSRHRIKIIERNVILFIFILMLSLGTISHLRYEYDMNNPGAQDVFAVSWRPQKTFTDLSPIGYHLLDSYMFFDENRTLDLSPMEENEIKQWFTDKKENIPDNKYRGIFKGKNLIVIQVESLENFVVNRKINNQEITPTLNRLIKNSLYFPRFVEQVNGGVSSDADLMTNTSVFPVRSGATFFRYPDNTYNSLPVLLQKQGYSTVAIHPDRGSYWNWMPALQAIGFQKCIDSTNFTMDETIGLGISDGSYFKQAEKEIVKEKSPFYTFMVTLSSHAPFQMPDVYKELKLPSYLEDTKLGGYFQAVHYTDKQIGNFLTTLDADGLLANTVIVIYGDHTAVHAYYNDEVQKIEPSQRWWLKDYNRIPLIIYQSEMKGELINVNGGQVDTLPTVAYLMGIDEKSFIDTAMGRNLLKTNKSFAVASYGVYYDDSSDAKQKDNALKGLDIGDMIIRSNYFNKQ
ncbi:MAG TPA: LTA synthase family protein [Syntrophomonadaceae bacterium]|nr:LTA synthase family protein [Syntrophomonadaceae bacterium]